MPNVVVQNDWTHGVLGKNSRGRFDLDLYNRSARYIENFHVTGSGSLISRLGRQYLFGETIPSTFTQVFPFYYDGDYGTIIIRQGNPVQFKIFEYAAVNINFLSSVSDVFPINMVQDGKDIYFAHQEITPVWIQYDPSTKSFTNKNFTFKNEPTFDYKKDYDSYTFTLTAVAPGSTTLTVSGPTNYFTTADIGSVFQGIGDTSVNSNLGHARITAVPSAPSNSCTVEIESQFDGKFTSGVSGKFCYYAQPAFNSTHGYPKAIAIDQGRLWFGGSQDLPNVVFASKSLDFTNFDIGIGLDGDAIQRTITGISRIFHIIGGKTLAIFTEDRVILSAGLYTTYTPSTLSFIINDTIGCSQYVPPVVFRGSICFVDNSRKSVYAIDIDSDGTNFKTINLLEMNQDSFLGIDSISLMKNSYAGQVGLAIMGSRIYENVAASSYGTAVLNWNPSENVLGLTFLESYYNNTPNYEQNISLYYQPLAVISANDQTFFVMESAAGRTLERVVNIYNDQFVGIYTHIEDNVFLDKWVQYNVSAGSPYSVTATHFLSTKVNIYVPKQYGVSELVTRTIYDTDASGNFTISESGWPEPTQDYRIYVGYLFDASIETLPLNLASRTNIFKRINKITIQYEDSYYVRAKLIFRSKNAVESDPRYTETTSLLLSQDGRSYEYEEVAILSTWSISTFLKLYRDMPKNITILSITYEVS